MCFLTMQNYSNYWKIVVTIQTLYLIGMCEKSDYFVRPKTMGKVGHLKMGESNFEIKTMDKSHLIQQQTESDFSSFLILTRTLYGRKQRRRKRNLSLQRVLPKQCSSFTENSTLNCPEMEIQTALQQSAKICVACSKTHRLFKRNAEETSVAPLASTSKPNDESTTQYNQLKGSISETPDQSEFHLQIESGPEGEAHTGLESEETSGYNQNVDTTQTTEPSPEIDSEHVSEPYSESESEPEPYPEPESEQVGQAYPESESGQGGHTYPESEQASEPHSEPESEDEAAAIAEAEQWPEPGPNWDKAIPKWGTAWTFHVIFFTIIFILISLTAFLLAFSTILERGWRRSSKSVIALSALVFSFSASRTIFFCADAYGHSGRVPLLFQRLIFSVGLPGFAASFSNLLLIILDTTKATTGPPRFLKLSFILGMYCVHLAIVVVSDVLVFVVQGSAEILLFLCQIFFVVYGLLCAAGFFYAAVILRRNLAASKNSVDPLQPRLRVLQFLSYCSGSVAASVGIVNLYISVSEMGVFSGVLFVEAWQWWSVHTITRALEAVACVMVLVAFMNTAKAASLRGLLTKWCPRLNPTKHSKVSILETSKSAWLDTINTTSVSQRCTTKSFQMQIM